MNDPINIILALLTILVVNLIIQCYRAGYWKGKYESLFEEGADHQKALNRHIEFLQQNKHP